MPTFRKLIEEQTKLALGKGLEESAIIRLILHFSKMESYQLYAIQDQECPPDIEKEFLEACKKYINELIPVQHITGFETFYGYDFMVNKDVLIPRFETEELVENLLYEYDDFFDKEVDVVDIGTGSGAIAITLAKEEPRMHVMATDISEEALAMAKKNAVNLGVDVDFLQGDMLEPVYGKKFDILVSNPPYIPSEEYVEPLVKDNEPHVALFGGIDGLKFYRIILSNAKRILKPKSIIAFEHAYNTGDALRKLIKEYFPLARIKNINDMAGRDRMTFIFNDSTKIKNGEVIIFPTDTVYGIGCKFNDTLAKKKIIDIKQRDPFKKIAVLCANLEQIEELCFVDDKSRRIIDAFLPGPLTIILKGKEYDTIGVRIPNNEIALKILSDNGPMSTTSVNISGCEPINDPSEIRDKYSSVVSHIYIDDNPKLSMQSSTVLDMTNGLQILREGAISLEDIKKVLQ